MPPAQFTGKDPVSTHSRPKAAGLRRLKFVCIARGFNTQPPEGGWASLLPPLVGFVVSTHSRPKAAGVSFRLFRGGFFVSTHSRPKAAGRHKLIKQFQHKVSTHSRPKAAGFALHQSPMRMDGFQHTAARRRLVRRI